LCSFLHIVLCGDSHTIFILEDGSCWSCGSNDHYQLGHENPVKDSWEPQRIQGMEGRVIVTGSAGYAHNLLVDSWGALFTFGSNSHGQCGHHMEDKLIGKPKLVRSLGAKVSRV